MEGFGLCKICETEMKFPQSAGGNKRRYADDGEIPGSSGIQTPQQSIPQQTGHSTVSLQLLASMNVGLCVNIFTMNYIFCSIFNVFMI